MRKKKRVRGWLRAVCAAGCMTLLLSGCRIGDKEFVLSKSLNNRQVFRIDRSICELKEAKVYLANYQNIYGTAYTVNLWEHDFGDDSLTDYVKDITLEELTTVYCMDLLAESQEMALTEEEQQKVADAAEEYYDSLSKEELSYLGVSEDDIEEYYGHYALAQKLYHSLTAGVDEEVSDDEARVMEIMQIFVTDAGQAGVVSQKLAAGEDFATVANNYNELPAIQVTVSRDDFPEEASEIVFRLENDETSQMITTEDGYYFIRCLNKYNVELTEENKKNIVAKRQKEAFDDIYREFAGTREAQLNEELWEELTLETGGEITTDSFFAVFKKHCGDI